MSSNLSSHEIIASALQLPLSERERVIDALHESLIDRSVDHGPDDPVREVQAAWSDEIARRLAEVDSGRVKTVPAEQAEQMIRDNARPRI